MNTESKGGGSDYLVYIAYHICTLHFTQQMLPLSFTENTGYAGSNMYHKLFAFL